MHSFTLHWAATTVERFVINKFCMVTATGIVQYGAIKELLPVVVVGLGRVGLFLWRLVATGHTN